MTAPAQRDDLATEAASLTPVLGRYFQRTWSHGVGHRLYDTDGTMSVLAGPFERAGYEHALIIMVDHEDCGAAHPASA